MTDNDLMRVRILVVEDDDTMRGFIVEILGSVGFTNLTTALDGIEAWREFEQGAQFDLVICDCIMPGMDGLAVMKNIRDSRAAIPFILVTVAIPQMRSNAPSIAVLPRFSVSRLCRTNWLQRF